MHARDAVHVLRSALASQDATGRALTRDTRRHALWTDCWDALDDGGEGRRDRPVVALLAGRFRPPHAGHVTLALRLLQCCDAVVIAVDPSGDAGRGDRSGAITPDLAAACWAEQLSWAGVGSDAGLAPWSGASAPPRAIICTDTARAAETLLFQEAERTGLRAVRVAGQEAQLLEPPDCSAHRRLPLLVLPRESGGISSSDVRARPLGGEALPRPAEVARVAALLFPAGAQRQRAALAERICDALW